MNGVLFVRIFIDKEEVFFYSNQYAIKLIGY